MPAIRVPRRNRFLDPMRSMYFPKIGENTIVVKKTLP